MVDDRSFLVRGLVHTPLGASLNSCLRPHPFASADLIQWGPKFRGFRNAWTGQEGLVKWVLHA